MLCKPIGLRSPAPLSILLYYWMCFRATVSVIWRVLAASSNGRRSEVASSSSLPLMSAWAIPCEWKIPPTASLAPLCGPNLGCREEKCASASALLISPSLWCGVGGKVYFFSLPPGCVTPRSCQVTPFPVWFPSPTLVQVKQRAHDGPGQGVTGLLWGILKVASPVCLIISLESTSWSSAPRHAGKRDFCKAFFITYTWFEDQVDSQ